MADWIEIGSVDEIPPLGARVVHADGEKIALFRTSNNEIFALRDRCPHKEGPLSQGIVHGKRVTCPLHNLVLELSDGKVVPPDEGCALTYPIKVEEGKVWIAFQGVAIPE
ncbi:nitrite reductase [Candidatus Nitromaritima sp. SCGC AAA799-A02]|nr:nitrite reductase [Candidatus Nitromaritima sp. SCGC AAA799-A02]KMP12175.1 nitrite reductase [Candidatus Nitromaritima sp. SCGC AAA799-C22]